jgi:2-keto-3-deoxy-L-rhamnonate aldolase RhmA
MLQTSNPILLRMGQGLPALGLTVRIVTNSEVVRIARATGHHFLRIDTQHAPFDLETITGIAGAGLSLGFGTVARVRGVDDPDLGLILDAGIGGLVFPDVDNVDKAREAVSVSRFPPLGSRSYGGTYPHFDYAPLPVAEAMDRLDRATLIGCMIEGREGLENLEEISAVDGVDLLHLGMSDMLIALGRPGEYEHPEIWSILDRMVQLATAHGKFVGCGGVPTVALQAEAIRRGARLVTTRADINFLATGAAGWARDLTDLVRDPGPGRDQS